MQAAGDVAAGETTVTCVDYSAADVHEQRVGDLATFLEQHRPAWSAVRWIDVVGFADLDAIHALAAKYELHPLALEDLLSHSQRPKIDAYGGAGSNLNARLFISTRALHLREGRLRSAPVSIFLGHTTVLTFQSTATGVFDPVHHRLTVPGSRLRADDASFLTYSLLDAVVDACFPIIDHFDGHLDRLENAVVEHVDPSLLTMIQDVKRQFALLRWSIWPMREVVGALQRDPHECMSDATKVYLHDLYDHVVQVIEINEAYRERAGDLVESYRSAVSFRLNEVIRVLTVISTVFIPLTFLAGVYGMNFHYLPELEQRWAYPAFWVVSLAVAGGMLAMFRRRRWL
ncbi:magnesium/cobalt transporter CorA [Actinotalea sp.]|uniref:magnesium/cobalt transporter CorA n=1 Tax=Actinotalea sp. TaxID=1872145 RepID=UPI002B579840|nr:magnesium/cobalt transporter CorA [Actinotalea sp.]HQY34753.1 magnesium/cobalt transporter CorA [Actinotalea sp.]HRA51412.1 magnesium/cobalt transporter CorA [Actinotalea sp.]